MQGLTKAVKKVDRSKSDPATSSTWRWVLWSFFVILWTAALLTTEPVHVAHAVLASPVIFPTAKLLHVSAYALLAVLSGWLFVPARWRWLLLVFLCFHAFGTEFFQQFVPERGPSLRDVGIDHIGIAIGLALSSRWWLQLHKTPPQ
jgi:VanZ family protein